MGIKNKIIWKKPDYKNNWGKVSDKEIDEYCISKTSSGDIRIEREQYGRKIIFKVFRLEKIGTLVEGLDTLSRHRLQEELEKYIKKEQDEKQKTKTRT